MVFGAHLMPCLTGDLDSKTFERAFDALPRLRIKYISFFMGFLPAFKTRGNVANFSADSNHLSFLFFSFLVFLIDKNAASSSSATVDAIVAAKGKQPAVEASEIPAAEAEWERFRADICQWPSGGSDYALGDDSDHEGCLLVKHATSLFANVSGDAIIVLASYACREDFLASTLRLIALVRDT